MFPNLIQANNGVSKFNPFILTKLGNKYSEFSYKISKLQTSFWELCLSINLDNFVSAIEYLDFLAGLGGLLLNCQNRSLL